MKTLLATSAALTLSLSISNADQFKAYDDHHAPCSSRSSSHGYGYDRDYKGKFLNRLNIAPRYYGCGEAGSKLYGLKKAAYSASKIDLIGKIEYRTGNSRLGYEAEHDIERLIIRSGLRHSPNALLVVMGYADKSGSSEANFRLSRTRARLVEKHIGHIGWEHGLQLQTASIAMGEEVELRNHGLKHNRVAEIWLVEFPRPVSHFMQIVEPVVQHRRVMSAPVPQTFVQPQILQAPVQTAPIRQTARFAAPTQNVFSTMPPSQPAFSPAPRILSQPQPQAANIAPQVPGGFAPQAPQMIQPPSQAAPAPQAPRLMAPPAGQIPAPVQNTETAPLAPLQNQIAPIQNNEITPAPTAPLQNQIAPPAPTPLTPTPQPMNLEMPLSPQPINLEAASPIQPQPTQEIAAAPAAPLQTQVMQMPAAPANPLQGLADFLEQNVVLSNDADRNEFSKKLSALKNMASSN